MVDVTAGGIARARPMTREEKKVILASSAGTVFEWYDTAEPNVLPAGSRGTSRAV